MANAEIPYGADPGTIGRRSAAASRTEDAVTRYWDRVIVEERRVRSFSGIAASFRMPGSAATPQNLFSIYNTTGSAIIASLDELYVSMVQTVANLTHPPWFTLTRITTAPTGGQAATKVSTDSRDSASAANVEVRTGATADGTASAITSTAGSQRLSSVFGGQLFTAVGALQVVRLDLLAAVHSTPELLLPANSGYLLQVNHAAAADNLATKSYIVDSAWSEFTEF